MCVPVIGNNTRAALGTLLGERESLERREWGMGTA